MFKKNLHEDNYVKVKKWIKLHKNIKSKGINLTSTIYKTYYLLNNAETSSDLYIKTKD